jgi:hypothetical protein
VQLARCVELYKLRVCVRCGESMGALLWYDWVLGGSVFFPSVVRSYNFDSKVFGFHPHLFYLNRSLS